MRVSYHTHSRYDDGAGFLEEYVVRAIELGFGALGFSGHAPLPFEPGWTIKQENLSSYLKEAYDLKEKYKRKIQLYIGLEMDYISGIDVQVPKGPEYTISSVHHVLKKDRIIPVDGPFDMVADGLKECYDGDGKAYTKDYYAAIMEMIEVRKPQVIGHLDLIKKNNRDQVIFNEEDSWYKEEIEKVLTVVKKAGSILEINTGAMSRKYLDCAYPSAWIISIMRQMDIPIQLNSDAHKPVWLDTAYDQTEALLKEIGYKTQRVLYDGIWQDMPF